MGGAGAISAATAGAIAGTGAGTAAIATSAPVVAAAAGLTAVGESVGGLSATGVMAKILTAAAIATVAASSSHNDKLLLPHAGPATAKAHHPRLASAIPLQATHRRARAGGTATGVPPTVTATPVGSADRTALEHARHLRGGDIHGDLEPLGLEPLGHDRRGRDDAAHGRRRPSQRRDVHALPGRRAHLGRHFNDCQRAGRLRRWHDHAAVDRGLERQRQRRLKRGGVDESDVAPRIGPDDRDDEHHPAARRRDRQQHRCLRLPTVNRRHQWRRRVD